MECRIEVIKPLRCQIENVLDALQYFVNDNVLWWDLMEPRGALKLHLYQRALPTSNISAFFVLWHDVLFEINITSKILQRAETFLSHFCRTKQFLLNLRCDKGFAGVEATEKELAIEIEVEPNFSVEPTVRSRRTGWKFNYEARDEPIIDSTAKFRTGFFSL